MIEQPTRKREDMHRILEQADREMDRIVDQAQSELTSLWRKARSSFPGESKQRSAEVRALEVMPEETKLLYTRAVIAQLLIDGEANPREIASMYVFMSRIGLDTHSRREARRYLSAVEEGRLTEIPRLAEEVVISSVEDREQGIVAAALVKDLLWISRTDGEVSSTERESVRAVAREHFGDQAEKVIEQAEETIDTEEAYVRGELSVSEFEKRIKQLASQAAAIGVPVAAIYFSGSVVGLSAAGFTSGLAALGLGGVLGLSAMLTGVGVVLVAGVVTYQAARWALGVNERELAKRREHMIQEVLKQHQKSMADLAQDIGEIAIQMEEYTARSDRNESRLARLKEDLQSFKAALATLKEREENLEYREQQFAT